MFGILECLFGMIWGVLPVGHERGVEIREWAAHHRYATRYVDVHVLRAQHALSAKDHTCPKYLKTTAQSIGNATDCKSSNFSKVNTRTQYMSVFHTPPKTNKASFGFESPSFLRLQNFNHCFGAVLRTLLLFCYVSARSVTHSVSLGSDSGTRVAEMGPRLGLCLLTSPRHV